MESLVKGRKTVTVTEFALILLTDSNNNDIADLLLSNRISFPDKLFFVNLVDDSSVSE